MDIQGALARGYCTERNSKKVLDPDLIIDMATEILALFPPDKMMSEHTATVQQVETILRNNSVVDEGYNLIIKEYKFSDICEEIYALGKIPAKPKEEVSKTIDIIKFVEACGGLEKLKEALKPAQEDKPLKELCKASQDGSLKKEFEKCECPPYKQDSIFGKNCCVCGKPLPAQEPLIKRQYGSPDKNPLPYCLEDVVVGLNKIWEVIQRRKE
jgi:hypothetical protein